MSNATASDLKNKTVVELVAIDRSKLDGQALAEINSVMADRLAKCVTGGSVVDPIKGHIIVASRVVGNASLPQNGKKKYMPKAWLSSTKGNTVAPDGKVTVDIENVQKGEVELLNAAKFSLRTLLLAANGNGFHSTFQNGKSMDAVADALASVGSDIF